MPTPDLDISLSAIVLAGGRSSRMGQDKALILIEGVPLLGRVCDIALQCAAKVYIVTPWQERYQSLLPTSCHFIAETPLTNEVKPHGPLIGFAQGLAQVQTQWVLLLACDLPCLKAKVLQAWAEKLKDLPEEAIALLPRHVKGWNPLCGFYRCTCLPSLTHFIEQGGRSFQPWLAQQLVEELPLNAQMLFNCNTPHDLVVLAET